jgi:hypothetical protein
MKEIRKLVSELKVGDEVKGYGVLAVMDGVNDLVGVAVSKFQKLDYWPADAEVTVLVKEKRWRVTFETADAAVADSWRTVRPNKLAAHADNISVEEVDV